MPRKKKIKRTKDETVLEWFSWINTWNKGELAKSFEEWLDKNGYHITEKR